MIFLAGSIKGEWQDPLKEELRRLRADVEIFDPRDHKLHDPAWYTRRDLEAIAECRLVIAVVEREQTNWAPVAFHIGYAKALGKRVLLINPHGAQSAHQVHQVCETFPDVGGLLAALPLMEEFRNG